MTQVLLATRNAKKLVELRRILQGASDVDLVGLDDVAAYDEAPETGATFADNALLKAREGARLTGLISIGDDSGLTVDALNGMPGVLSARWAGRPRDDQRNVDLVLDQLADVPVERRSAAFVCAVAVVTPDGREEVVEGRMAGAIEAAGRGAGGFGYDPIFVATGYTRTTAELTPAEKDAISHRGRALRALVPVLERLVGPNG